jgi:hypothetical protein
METLIKLIMLIILVSTLVLGSKAMHDINDGRIQKTVNMFILGGVK